MKIFDLHCDTATEALRLNRSLGNSGLQLDGGRLPPELTLAQTFAVFIPDERRGEDALNYFLRCSDYWQRETESEQGHFHRANGVRGVRSLWNSGKHAALLSVEGGAVLAGQSSNIRHLKERSVWMLTLTWNGENELGAGARSQGGLTDFGREAIPLLEEQSIAVDVSHLNDETFWDVMKIARRPVAASHSCSRSLCNVPRNLTDDQFRAIMESGGIVGLNFYPDFLTDTPQNASIEDILRHAEHFLSMGGETSLALGSDFDGAAMPQDMPDAAHLPLLAKKLEHAFGKELAEAICYKNALDFYSRFAAE